VLLVWFVLWFQPSSEHLLDVIDATRIAEIESFHGRESFEDVGLATSSLVKAVVGRIWQL
jgi:hypothetical protein